MCPFFSFLAKDFNLFESFLSIVYFFSVSTERNHTFGGGDETFRCRILNPLFMNLFLILFVVSCELLISPISLHLLKLRERNRLSHLCLLSLCMKKPLIVFYFNPVASRSFSVYIFFSILFLYVIDKHKDAIL